MLFPTIDFAVFFVIVFTGSWMLRPYAKAWRWFLLLASCVFYLDPFNPIATDGQEAVHTNIVIALAIAGTAAATTMILKAAFGTTGGSAAVAGGHRQRVRAGMVAGDDDLESLASGDAGIADDEIGGEVPRLNRASIVAPLLVCVLIFGGDIVMSGQFSERKDQNWRFLFLLIGVVFINQTFAQAVFAALGPTRERTPLSRWLVRVAVVVDLLVLGFFKYHEFFHLDDLLRALGINITIILPIAISFFTFQAISYVVDIGRGELRPIPLLDFAVYLTFFAHVVAGPIVRVKEFAPQLDARADPRYVQSAEAFELIFRGLFKKVVISSYLAAQIVKPVFDAPQAHTKIEVLFGILGYAVQIYADFSGYTDIAIGVALLLGIRFPQNFDAPYRALSLQDFWRRWHMTLSRWLRDYLYIPLGGNRLGYSRTYVNLFLTMAIGGLWHGANWTFIIWGVIHGAGMGIERFVKERWTERGPLGLPVVMVNVLQWFVTFSIVCFAWVFFNATDIPNALAVLSQLFFGEGLAAAPSLVTPMLMAVVGLSIASQFVPPEIPKKASLMFSRTPPVVQVVVGAAGLGLINVLGPEGVAPFIYFQF